MYRCSYVGQRRVNHKVEMQTAVFILHSRVRPRLQVKSRKHGLNRYHGNVSHETHTEGESINIDIVKCSLMKKNEQ